MICPHCSSEFVRKQGVRRGKQRYCCTACNKWFSTDYGDQFFEIKKDVEPGSILNVKSKKTLRIYCATDIHHGAEEHHDEKFDEFIDTVDKDPDAKWFMNGDNIELIPPNYKISQRGQSMENDEQHLTFIERVKKIQKKLLFVRGGNHDMIRSVNILGFDVTKVLASHLGVPYYRMPGYTQIDIDGTKWNLVSGHGKSGGKNGDLELDKMAAVYSDGDIFFLGHNHQLYAKPIDSLRIDNNEERIHRRWYCRGGSFLKYAEYARYSFFPIVRTGWVTMEFSKDKIKCWSN